MEQIEFKLKEYVKLNWKNPKPINVLIIGVIIIAIVVLKKVL